MKEEDSGARNLRRRQELVAEILERSQKILSDVAKPERPANADGRLQDPLNLTPLILELTKRMMVNPTAIFQAQLSLWQDYVELWQKTSRRLLGQPLDPSIKPPRQDRSPRDPAWDDDAVFSVIKQSYLLTSRWLIEAAFDIGDLDDKTRRKLDFYNRQFVDAITPSDFVADNPDLLRKTLETGGENLLQGLNHLLEDLDHGKSKLAIEMADLHGLEIGETLAATPGKVIFQTGVMQLIQYQPTTNKVFEHPLLIIPPWINKPYLFDLKPDDSFVKFALDQGLTVFVIAWIDPGPDQADKTFEDYVKEGPLAALDAIAKACGETAVNAVGYCLGGTLLAAALASMAAMQDKRIKSASLFATLIDFENPGDLGMFIDEEQLALMDQTMPEKDNFNGHEMTATRTLLRANDLIWSFVISAYRSGKEPLPSDLLYWNADQTRLPKTMHSFYLQEIYQKNKLAKPGGLSIGGMPIDLTKIRLPIYMLATKEDHIAPWSSAYAATQIFRGEISFTLAGSGHVAGVIDPEGSSDDGFWLNDKLPADPKDWFETAKRHDGSWWMNWLGWIKKRSGAEVTPRKPGQGGLAIIEDAPGRHVRASPARAVKKA